MKRLHRGGCWWVVVLAALVGLVSSSCSSRPTQIRYGSLIMSERAFNYRHNVEFFTMANGLVVALLPDAHANLVSVDIRYRTGAADDPVGKTGLAHLVEHVTFEQRDEPGGPTLNDLLALAALGHNAETTWDATHYHEFALAGKLDELLKIEATRMTRGCAGLDQAAVDHERAVVLQELAQRGPHSLLDAVMGDLFGATHRYAAGVGGTDLATLTLDDVCDVLSARYTPDQAILVVAGRFDADAVRRSLANLFVNIPRRPVAQHSPVPQLTLRGTASEHHADTDEAAALVVFPAAPWGSHQSFDDELIDRLLLARLRRLDREQRWVTGVDAGLLGGKRDGARYFALSVADPGRLNEAIDQIFKIATELPGNDSGLELGAAAAQRRTMLFSEFESVFDRGSHCADYLQFTRHGSFHLQELGALQAIDTDRLLQRAKHMTRAESHVVKVFPTKSATAARSERPALHAAATIDAPLWRAPVDPAEAERPLNLPEQRRPPSVTELRLPNGLRVVMSSGFMQPVLEARLVFPGGSFNSGVVGPEVVEAAAALLDHNPQVSTLKDLMIVPWVMRLGSLLSYDVGEATTFTVRGSSTFADWHVWRLHWLLENGTYDPDDVAHARAAASEQAARDRAARRDTNTGWRRAIRVALFGRSHPYARDLGSAATIRAGELEDFRETRYRANGATLIIVGQFDRAAMTKTVTELFGVWPDDPPPPSPPVPPMQPLAGPSWLAHDEPDAQQIRIALAFAATSSRDRSRGARAVVAEMVRNRFGAVRSRLGASYGLRIGYEITEAGDVLEVTGQVDADRAGEVARALQRDLDGLRHGDETFAADFVRARRTALARALADPVMSSIVANDLQDAVTTHRALDASATLPAAIAATTLREVRAVIAADLQASRMVGLLGGRSADVAAAYAAAGIAHP
jgi:zinc protease